MEAEWQHFDFACVQFYRCNKQQEQQQEQPVEKMYKEILFWKIWPQQGPQITVLCNYLNCFYAKWWAF